MDNKIDWAYMTMACFLKEEYAMPGVENAFAEGSFCLEEYSKILGAYSSLCHRLGLDEDSDADVETIINSFLHIQEELCFRMYRYGALYGLDE